MEIHGPTIAETWDHITPWLGVAWLVAFAFWGFSIFIWYQHRAELMQQPRTFLRELYLRICSLSVVFSTTAFLTLLFPRPAFCFAFIRAIYESFTLKFFEYNMTELLAVVGSPAGGYGSMEETRQRGLKILLAEPPQKYYGAPPLGCCWLPCLSPVTYTDRLFTISKRFVSQYMYIRPLSGLIILWMILDDSFGGVEDLTGYPEGTVLGGIESLSMLIAMQGLFMIYWASRRRLHDYHPGLKFVAIKLVIFVSALQEFAIDLFVQRPADGSFYDHEARAQLWSNAFLLAESAALTLLMWHAFPYTELARAHAFRLTGKDEEYYDAPNKKYHSTDPAPVLLDTHPRSESA